MACRNAGKNLHGPAPAVPCPVDVQHPHELSSLALKQSPSHTVDTVLPARQGTWAITQSSHAEVTDPSELKQLMQ